MSKQLIPRSLRGQLLVLVLIALLPFAALQAWNLYADARDDERQARERVFRLALVTASDTAGFLGQAQNILNGLAARPAVQALDPARCDPILKDFLALAPRFANVATMRLDGRVVCSAAPITRPARMDPRKLLARLRGPGELTVGEITPGTITGRWAIPVGVPLPDGRGGVAGAVGLAIDLLHLPVLPNVDGLPSDAVVGIVAADGTVLAHSAEAERFVGTNNLDRPETRRLLAEKSGTAEETGLDGILRIRGYTPIPGTDWIVVASLPASEVYANVRARIATSALLAIVALCAALVLALRWSREILKPITALAGVTRDVAAGNLAARAAVSGAAEIAAVAEQFNRMLETRRRADAELRASEEKLRLFVRFAPSAIAMFDRQMRFIAYSRRWLADYGLGEQELAGRSHYEVFPELPERWKETHRRCLAGAVERADEDPFPRADGSIDWVRWEVHPWREEAGGIGGIIIFSEVITERKRAEEALRESEERLRRVLDNMFPFVGLLSLDGRVLEANRAPLEAAGLKREEVIGRPCAEILWFSYSSEVQERLRTALARAAAGEAVRYDETIRVSGGRFMAIDLMFSPLRDTAGQVVSIVGSATDISERKAAEIRLQAYAEELQRLSRRVIEAAETERRAISRELHDRIGQNLATLNLNLGLIRVRIAPAAPGEVLRRIDDAQILLEATTRQARDLMAELHPPALEDFGLLAALRAHAETFTARTGLRVTVAGEECAPRPAPALELALLRIAQEALANTAKHARAAGVEVVLAASAKRVTLTIADDGCGFDAGAARTGANWGLAIMRERAAAAGAELRIESAPGCGTRVTVELAREAA